MINKVAITSANLIDAKDFKHFAPNSGAVYADKGYGGNKYFSANQQTKFSMRCENET